MKKKMKTWRLEKAPILNDGTQGEWGLSYSGKTPELWYDEKEAQDVAIERDFMEIDGCYWRVEGHESW